MGQADNLKCPKCGSNEVHTWIKCVCYNCGHSGDYAEFGATHERIMASQEFARIIYQMRESE